MMAIHHKTESRISFLEHTDDLIELLPVVENQVVDLGIDGLVGDTLCLLRFRQLLDRSVHAHLKDSNFLILLLPDTFNFLVCQIEFGKNFIDVVLFGLNINLCQS